MPADQSAPSRRLFNQMATVLVGAQAPVGRGSMVRLVNWHGP